MSQRNETKKKKVIYHLTQSIPLTGNKPIGIAEPPVERIANEDPQGDANARQYF